jgi:predicted glycosyltransferase
MHGFMAILVDFLNMPHISHFTPYIIAFSGKGIKTILLIFSIAAILKSPCRQN